MGVLLYQSPESVKITRIDGFTCLLVLKFSLSTPLNELTGVVIECYRNETEECVSFFFDRSSLIIEEKGYIRMELRGLIPEEEMTLDVYGRKVY